MTFNFNARMAGARSESCLPTGVVAAGTLEYALQGREAYQVFGEGRSSLMTAYFAFLKMHMVASG
jgi:hypothetical protein